MVGLITDSGYESISTTFSVNIYIHTQTHTRMVPSNIYVLKSGSPVGINVCYDECSMYVINLYKNKYQKIEN